MRKPTRYIKKWEKRREKGKLRFILLYGGFFCGFLYWVLLCFVLPYLILKSWPGVFYHVNGDIRAAVGIFSVFTGLITGGILWKIGDYRYFKALEKSEKEK